MLIPAVLLANATVNIGSKSLVFNFYLSLRAAVARWQHCDSLVYSNEQVNSDLVPFELQRENKIYSFIFI